MGEPKSNEQTIREAAIKTAEYLYGVEGDTFQGEVEAIGQLRQLINEEFVGKNKTVSSQLIYNMMHPFITRYGLEQRKAELRQASDMQYMMRRADRISYCSNRMSELQALTNQEGEI